MCRSQVHCHSKLGTATLLIALLQGCGPSADERYVGDYDDGSASVARSINGCEGRLLFAVTAARIGSELAVGTHHKERHNELSATC